MPVITSIEFQKNKQDRVNIFLDGEFFCGMQELTCVKHSLKAGKEVSKETLTDYVLESDKEAAMNKVGKLLGHGLKTEKQLIAYLVSKGYDPIIQQYILDKLKQYNIVDDEHFARAYVADHGRICGRKKLEYALINKGISKELISKVLENFEVDEDAILNEAKKFLKNKEINSKQIQKLIQHLSYKGYEWEDITKVITALKKDDAYDSRNW